MSAKVAPPNAKYFHHNNKSSNIYIKISSLETKKSTLLFQANIQNNYTMFMTDNLTLMMGSIEFSFYQRGKNE